MARKGKGHHKGRGDPLKGSPLNRLSFYQARPINRDALRVVEPQDASRKRVGATVKRDVAPIPARTSRQGPRYSNDVGRRQVCKADGTIVPVLSRKPDT